MTDNYAVTGNPINHSQSPQIHTAFAKQTGENLSYTKLLLPIDGFKQGVEKFFAEGGKGLNITVPFKLQAWQLADKRSQRAEHGGAVNTLVKQPDGTIYGDNTDGAGLVRDLTNNNIELKNKSILLLGAGGAIRGVIPSLLEKAPQCIVIANRTESKAEELAKLFGNEIEIIGCGFNAIADTQYDVIINGTAASLQGEMPALPKHLRLENSCCYDMMYSAKETIFNNWARKKNAAKILDGLGMLVEQAAESFFIWRGVRPETTAVIQTIKNNLK